MMTMVSGAPGPDITVGVPLKKAVKVPKMQKLEKTAKVLQPASNLQGMKSVKQH